MVGVAEVKPEQGWVEFFVADPFGADWLARVALADVASVEVLNEEWHP